MNTSFRQLQAFVHTHKLRSLTRAAERMHITQSAVSVLIRQLESAWKTRLFDRTTRALHPTEEADVLIVIAERILRDADFLDAEAAALSSNTRGQVSVAVTASVASSILPSILKRFARQHPHLVVVVHDVAPDQLMPRLMDDEVELAIGTLEQSAGIQLETLFTDQMGVICSKAQARKLGPSIRWRDLSAHQTISVRRGGDIRKLIDNSVQRRKQVFRPSVEVSLLGTALAMTAQGLGMSVLPTRLLPHFAFPQLTSIPLVDPVVERHLSVITRTGRTMSNAARSFIAVAKEETGLAD